MRVARTARGRIVVLVVLLLVLVPAATLLETGFVLFEPGEAEDLSELVAVEGASASEGRFLMMTVMARSATAALVVYGLLHPAVSVYHRSQVVPEGMNLDEYAEHTRRLMVESQQVALLVAMRHLDTAATLEGRGVSVAAIVPDGRWETLARGTGLDVRTGDVIITAVGREVSTVDDLLAAFEAADRSGEQAVEVTRVRDGTESGAVIPLELLPADIRDSGLLARDAGILLATVSPSVATGVGVEIEVGSVGGPSAGLMFVLEVVDRLTPRDLTGGLVIAGTGALSELGEVLPVGGISQKVRAAEAVGAELMFVPSWQETEALRAAGRIRVAAVASVTEAVDYLLTELSPTGSSAVNRAAAANPAHRVAQGPRPGRWLHDSQLQSVAVSTPLVRGCAPLAHDGR